MKKPTKEAEKAIKEPTPAYLEAVRLYDNIYKAVFYIHTEFAKMLAQTAIQTRTKFSVSQGKGKPKVTSPEFLRLEDQFLRKYGITKLAAKFGSVYVQDEVRKDQETGNQISMGPDVATLEFIKTLDEKGHQDTSAREAFIKRREAEYERVFATHDEKGSGKGDSGTDADGTDSNPRETEGDGGREQGTKDKVPGKENKKGKEKV